MGLSYTSLWLLGIVLVLFRKNLTGVMELASHMVTFARSMSRVLVLIAEATQLYSISTTGLIVVFGSAALVFLGIGLISKEELA